MRRNPWMVIGLCAALGIGACGGESADSSDSSGSSDITGAGQAATNLQIGGTVADAEPPALGPGPVGTETDALSTFAIDVDGGSYTLCRAAVEGGVVPDASLVRAEEFVNFFDMDYDAPTDAPFAIHADGIRGDDGKVEMRVGIQARRPEQGERKRAVLTFVIDVSGSMADPGKLDLVKASLLDLVQSLDVDDQVAIVVYSDASRVVLQPTAIADRTKIVDAITALTNEGSTNAQAGLALGYEVSGDAFDPDAINRVILSSDGLANQGDTSTEGMLQSIEEDAVKGIQLLTLGFGANAYNDSLMEQLADKGDGFYAFVDGPRESRRLFTENLTSTLETVALDAKVQVEFDPDLVRSYRLVGYDNRAVADDDFANDAVDGGEIGSGHSVTALYELELADGVAVDDVLATVHLRWLDVKTREPSQLDRAVAAGEVSGDADDPAPTLRLALLAADYAAALGARDEAQLSAVAVRADALSATIADDDVTELAVLARAAASLA